MRISRPAFLIIIGATLMAGCDDPAEPDELSLLRISPDSAVISGGDSLRFDASLPGSSVEWRVTFQAHDWFGSFPRDYPDMVGESGWIRGLLTGSGLLIASAGELADTASVRVVPGFPATAGIGWIAPRLWSEHRYGFPAVVRDPVGNRTEGEVLWSSETPDLLALAEDGTALPADSGTATFTLALEGESPSDTSSVLILPFSGEWRAFGLGLGTSAMGVWCALDTGGRVSCSGGNEYGTLGIATPLDRYGSGGQYAWRRGASFGYPVDTDVLFRSVELGFGHVCALGEDGLAYCWGEASAIGNEEDLELCFSELTQVYCRFEPRPVSPDLVFLDITPSCGVTATGDVWCWGRSPELAFTGTPLRTFDGDPEEGCGLSGEGAAYCWGSNAYGQLGTGTVDTLPHPDPVPVDTELRFVEISRLGRHACGLTAGGEIWCWGLGVFGQLGTEETLQSCIPAEPGGDPLPCAPSPVHVSSDAVFAAVDAGGDHTCGVAASGSLYCWGVNHYGQVSPDGSVSDTCLGEPCSRLPQVVSLRDAATSVTAGLLTTCAGMADGSFRCWGLIDRGFEPIEGFASP